MTCVFCAAVPVDGSADKGGMQGWLSFGGLWMLGDDHQVSLDLDALPPHVSCVCVAFTLIITHTQHAGMLESVCCRLLLDPRAEAIGLGTAHAIEAGTELNRFAMGCQFLGPCHGVVLGRLERVVEPRPDGSFEQIAWKFVAMGRPLQAPTPGLASREISDMAAPWLQHEHGGVGGVGSGHSSAHKKLFEQCDEESIANTVMVPIDVTYGAPTPAKQAAAHQQARRVPPGLSSSSRNYSSSSGGYSNSSLSSSARVGTAGAGNSSCSIM